MSSESVAVDKSCLLRNDIFSTRSTVTHVYIYILLYIDGGNKQTRVEKFKLRDFEKAFSNHDVCKIAAVYG